jgi:hypothetical protein
MATNRAPTETSALRHAAGAEESNGFAGHLRCASLADLVQLECLSGARTAVTVQAGEQSGHLFFDGGALVHAEAGELTGTNAAFAILEWSQGTFAQSSIAWPGERSIDIPWQQLLMISAQRRDEEGRDRGPKTLSSVRSSNKPAAVSGAHPRTTRQPPPPPRRVHIPPRKAELAPSQAPEQSCGTLVEHLGTAARIAVDGRVLAVRGASSELVELAAYVRNLVDLIGDDLGMGEFSTLECRLPTRQLLFIADTPESTLVIEAALELDPAELARNVIEQM